MVAGSRQRTQSHGARETSMANKKHSGGVKAFQCLRYTTLSVLSSRHSFCKTEPSEATTTNTDAVIKFSHLPISNLASNIIMGCSSSKSVKRHGGHHNRPVHHQSKSNQKAHAQQEAFNKLNARSQGTSSKRLSRPFDSAALEYYGQYWCGWAASWLWRKLWGEMDWAGYVMRYESVDDYKISFISGSLYEKECAWKWHYIYLSVQLASRAGSDFDTSAL